MITRITRLGLANILWPGGATASMSYRSVPFAKLVAALSDPIGRRSDNASYGVSAVR